MYDASQVKTLDCYYGSPGREETLYYLRNKGYIIEKVIWPTTKNIKLNTTIESLMNDGFKCIQVSRQQLKKIAQSDDWAADGLISIGFPFIFDQAVLERYKIAINSHPTLLPKYRGPSSGAYILLNDEKETGLTIHLIDSGMDTGPIVVQESFPITKFDTIRSIQHKTYALEPKAMIKALELLSTPGFVPLCQNKNDGSTFPRQRTPDDSLIDPSQPLNTLYNAIRACDPNDFPAHFYVEGQKVCIKMWRPDKITDDPYTL